MEGLEKLFKNITLRIERLEKQVGFLIDHLNHIENISQKHEWEITALQLDKKTVK